MQTPSPSPTWFRKILLGIGLGTALLLFIWQASRFTNPAALGLADFIAYWSAGHLIALGENPYSPELLLPLQKDLGWLEDRPNIMYYPPWTLPFVMPFGMLPYGISRLIWLLLHLGLVLACANLTWNYFGGSPNQRWLAWTVTLVFVPTLIVLKMGQIGPLLWLGIIGFLVCEKRQWDWLAGAALMVAAIKPQLVYLFGLAALFWAVDQGRWRVLAGGILAGLAATGIAMVRNPQVVAQYGYAVAHPPSGNITPTIGAFLRLYFGEDKTWLQFVPTIAGFIWFVYYWMQHRRKWSWPEEAPLLVLVSFLTTAYGSWIFDVVVLLLAVLPVSVWVYPGENRTLTLMALVAFVVIDGIILVMNLQEATYPSFVWVTPAILIGYLILRRSQPPTNLAPSLGA